MNGIKILNIFYSLSLGIKKYPIAANNVAVKAPAIRTAKFKPTLGTNCPITRRETMILTISKNRFPNLVLRVLLAIIVNNIIKFGLVKEKEVNNGT